MRQRVDQFERAVHRRYRLQRVDVGKPGEPRHLLVEAGVVLHRARTERVQTAVDRVVLLRQPREMAHDLWLAETGEADRSLAVEPAQPRRDRGRLRQIATAMTGRALLEQQRFLDLQAAIAADRLDSTRIVCR